MLRRWTSREPRLRLTLNGRPKRSEATVRAMGEYAQEHGDVAQESVTSRGRLHWARCAPTRTKETPMLALRVIRERLRTSELLRCLRAAVILDRERRRLAQVARPSTRTASSTTTRTSCEKPPRSAQVVSKVSRSGLLPERVFLDITQRSYTMGSAGHESRARLAARTSRHRPAPRDERQVRHDRRVRRAEGRVRALGVSSPHVNRRARECNAVIASSPVERFDQLVCFSVKRVADRPLRRCPRRLDPRPGNSRYPGFPPAGDLL